MSSINPEISLKLAGDVRNSQASEILTVDLSANELVKHRRFVGKQFVYEHPFKNFIKRGNAEKWTSTELSSLLVEKYSNFRLIWNHSWYSTLSSSLTWLDIVTLHTSSVGPVAKQLGNNIWIFEIIRCALKLQIKQFQKWTQTVMLLNWLNSKGAEVVPALVQSIV